MHGQEGSILILVVASATVPLFLPARRVSHLSLALPSFSGEEGETLPIYNVSFDIPLSTIVDERNQFENWFLSGLLMHMIKCNLM